jgi:diaminopimelate epimerase
MVQNFEVPFVKYHGLGNDFLVALASHVPRTLPDFARKILDRHTGVGGDGFIVVMKPASRAHDARIRFFNADGSEPEMSGNGIRCAGAFLIEGERGKRALDIETAAGVKSLERTREGGGKWTFRVRMGAPILEARSIPFRPRGVSSPVLGYRLRTRGGELSVTVTSMGNPHCSVFVADFEKVNWQELGREVERNEHFPNRTNVEFVRVLSRREIAVRFWERGVGHTLSSGTGSCAATVAAILNGFTDRQVRVQAEAGTLEVSWPEGEEVWLTGPVERVVKGKYYYHARREVRRGRTDPNEELGAKPAC